uniref:Uncharacterized protein n=1 Tax=Siphoviridae sp. ctvyM23 TaxID=2826514 RepID=A0A8S5MHK0_9CAUD|nr:MAG TPA: hypothetical protein [Siphoviridae sp. ctvyM23]
MTIKVFNVEFQSLAQLQKALGYASQQSKAFIIRQYGSIEQMALIRLKTQDKKEASKKLRALLDTTAAAGTKAQKKELKTIYKCLFAAWSQLDELQQLTIIKTVAGAENINYEELQEKIRKFKELNTK